MQLKTSLTNEWYLGTVYCFGRAKKWHVIMTNTSCFAHVKALILLFIVLDGQGCLEKGFA